jgi:hypothetical protein
MARLTKQLEPHRGRGALQQRPVHLAMDARLPAPEAVDKAELALPSSLGMLGPAARCSLLVGWCPAWVPRMVGAARVGIH